MPLTLGEGGYGNSAYKFKMDCASRAPPAPLHGSSRRGPRRGRHQLRGLAGAELTRPPPPPLADEGCILHEASGRYLQPVGARRIPHDGTELVLRPEREVRYCAGPWHFGGPENSF